MGLNCHRKDNHYHTKDSINRKPAPAASDIKHIGFPHILQYPQEVHWLDQPVNSHSDQNIPSQRPREANNENPSRSLFYLQVGTESFKAYHHASGTQLSLADNSSNKPQSIQYNIAYQATNTTVSVTIIQNKSSFYDTANGHGPTTPSE